MRDKGGSPKFCGRQLWMVPTHSACKRMTPGHGFDPQPGEPPARLVLEREAVAPGQPLGFTIEGGEFKGFIVQARVDPEENVQVRM